MTEEEAKEIGERRSVAIIAPAGHGKTEMIADLVALSEGKQLVLTHTNAGVDALKKRFNRKKIKKKYVITTIASFCVKYCSAYYRSAHFDIELSPINGSREDVKEYYQQLYEGMNRLLQLNWVATVIKSSYSRVIVDEYQDCSMRQHTIMLSLNKILPIVVLGDPLQGIFDFAEPIVNWNTIEFPIVDIHTEPWRWKHTNPELGDYLTNIRPQLLPTLKGKQCELTIDDSNKNVVVISPSAFSGYSLLQEISSFGSTVYIAKWPKAQLYFCTSMPGIFQYDEKQDCDELFEYAKLFDSKKDADLLLTICQFAARCMTGINLQLASYINRLSSNNFDFSRIKKYTDFGELIKQSIPTSKQSILNILEWFDNNESFKIFRKELLQEMERSVKYAFTHDTSIFNAACLLRRDSGMTKRYSNFRYLSSRTLLSKGLEYDCVIIDMRDPLNAKNFYVAMTRAKKKIYIISNSNSFVFKD